MTTMKPSRASRSPGIDLKPEVAASLLEANVKAVDMAFVSCFKYAKQKVSQGPAWEDLWKHRAFLMSLVSATSGRLLKQTSWELAVATFFEKQAPGKFNSDQVARGLWWWLVGGGWWWWWW